VDHGAAARDKQRLATDLLTSVILQAGYEDWANPQSTLQSAARLENPSVDFEPDVYPLMQRSKRGNCRAREPSGPGCC
jgi:Tfp pilus assembly protein PilW